MLSFVSIVLPNLLDVFPTTILISTQIILYAFSRIALNEVGNNENIELADLESKSARDLVTF